MGFITHQYVKSSYKEYRITRPLQTYRLIFILYFTYVMKTHISHPCKTKHPFDLIEILCENGSILYQDWRHDTFVTPDVDTYNLSLICDVIFVIINVIALIRLWLNELFSFLKYLIASKLCDMHIIIFTLSKKTTFFNFMKIIIIDAIKK